tara:strand:- start:92 stop:622 length:531 start_codon:yes stop_codon:yes gene_type:complete
MNNYKKYAQALYESSKDSKELLENIQHEIEHVAYLYKKESAFRLVFNSMRITNDKKRNIIKGTLKQFSPIITEFLSIVIEHNQSNQLLNIISRFNHLVATHSNIQKIDIITAQELDQSYLNDIVQTLSATMNVKPSINHIVEPEIIGGMKLRIGNKIFDNSMRYQLNQLKKTLHNL